MQDDGNLVLYCGPSNNVVWATHTHGIAINGGLILQADGNLVLYRYNGTPVWNSVTSGTEVERFVVQNDGNFVGYGKYGKVFWASHTHGKC